MITLLKNECHRLPSKWSDMIFVMPILTASNNCISFIDDSLWYIMILWLITPFYLVPHDNLTKFQEHVVTTQFRRSALVYKMGNTITGRNEWRSPASQITHSFAFIHTHLWVQTSGKRVIWDAGLVLYKSRQKSSVSIEFPVCTENVFVLYLDL